MHSVRPSSSSFRCLNQRIPSTSRTLATHAEHSTGSVEEHPSKYKQRLKRREQTSLQKQQYSGPRPLYNPKQYLESLPKPPFSPVPASTDPQFTSWITKEGPEGGARFQQPPTRGPNWMGGNVVRTFLFSFVCNLTFSSSHSLPTRHLNLHHHYRML
jgi:hypothetical protein